MEWQDEEFEAFLRRFHPPAPKALPARRRAPLVALAAAAAIAAAVLIPMRFRSQEPAHQASPSASATPAAAGAPDRSRTPAPIAAAPEASSDTVVYATTKDGAVRVRVGGAVKPPRKVRNVDPVYPEDAKAAGVGGIVELDIVIDEDGTVSQVLVVRSIPELDQAAIDAVEQWRFEPTLLNGQPVEVAMIVTVNFTLG